MPYINFSYKIIVSFIAIFISFYLRAEPFLSPHDPFLRHEIRLLQDEGSLNSTINNWPLNLGGLRSEKNQHSWNHDLLGNTIQKENRSGLAPIQSSIGISDDRVTSRSFGNQPRGGFTTGFETSWMNDRFAAKLSLLALYGVENDWKGRKDEGLELDGSYIAARLGNWSASLGKVDRWWGPGWDGSLILSTNARPIPAISLDRRISEPFENKWLSWIGPWSFQSFIGQMEEDRTVPNPYLWGIRVDFKPTILNGFEVGLFRMMQLGGDGRPEGLSTWIDAFLSQDNTGANTGRNPALEPGNQLAGLDIRWRPWEAPFALYGQVVGEDEDKFLPNCLMFQYGIEGWRNFTNGTARIFVEYVDLTSTWWTDDSRTHNVSYGHHIYSDGYRYRGRPVGHWADTDSRIISLGGFLQYNSGIGWGSILRTGDLNEDDSGNNSVSNGVASDYFAIEIFNSRSYDSLNLDIQTSLGWEEVEVQSSSTSESGMTFSATITKLL
tara:strand:+ start:2438 stop:3922 length:1485 start_codon:yes stop_codon:yes gene_type:complete